MRSRGGGVSSYYRAEKPSCGGRILVRATDSSEYVIIGDLRCPEH